MYLQEPPRGDGASSRVNFLFVFSHSLGSCWAIVRILISPSALADEFFLRCFDQDCSDLLQGTINVP